MAQASMDLTSTANVKTFLGVSGSGDDTLLGTLVTRASAAMEHYCDREFKQKSRTEYYDGNGANEIAVRNWPISGTPDIWIDTGYPRAYGSATKVDSDNIITYPEEGVIYLLGYVYTAGARTVKITYTGGVAASLATLPEDVQQACIECVAAWYNRGKEGAPGFESEGLGGRSATYADAGSLPENVKRMLDDGGWVRADEEMSVL